MRRHILKDTQGAWLVGFYHCGKLPPRVVQTLLPAAIYSPNNADTPEKIIKSQLLLCHYCSKTQAQEVNCGISMGLFIC